MLQSLTGFLAEVGAAGVAYVAAAALFSAMFHSVSGYAGGLILAILISPIIGVKAIVPVMAVSLLVSHTTRAWAFRRGFQWPVYRNVMTTALPGVAVGAAIYSYMPVDAVAALLGVFLIGTVPLRYWLKRKDVVVGRKSLMGIGVPFGVLSGATIGAGMILAPFFLGAGLAGLPLLGTMSAIAFTVNVIKTGVFSGFAVLDGPMLLVGLLIGLCTVPGNLAGRWIVMNTPIRIHIRLVETVVVLGGVHFLYRAGDGFGWW